jgi:hypothetical protein
MEENEHQLIQHELEVHEVMTVHREERVFPSIYPCSEFMRAAGILQDFQTLISNAGLEHFIVGEFLAVVLMMQMTDQLGTPREGVMSTAASFPSVIKPRLIKPVGKKPNSRR